MSSSAAAGTAASHQAGAWYAVPDLSLRDHRFAVPLDHSSSGSPSITVFAREVVAAGKEEATLPYLMYLQGGPGFESPRPTEASGWVKKACEEYRVVLLDQRGTGLSTPLTTSSLSQITSAAEQVEYLKHFRADNIVKDAEFIRLHLVPDAKPWTILGQSYGGFCAVTYLSFAPEGLKSVLLTGGLPPLGKPCTADTVYRACFKQVQQQNEKYYKRYPQDIQVIQEVVRYLSESEGGGVLLPSGGRLTPKMLQCLGLSGLGSGGGFERLHYLLERVWDPILVPGTKKNISYYFLKEFEMWLGFDQNPLYALLHESICETLPFPPIVSLERRRRRRRQIVVQRRPDPGFPKNCVCPLLVQHNLRMAWGQGARPIARLLSRAQQQATQGYTSSAAFQTHLLSNHFPQNGILHRRFSSEVPASEQMSLIKQLRERTCAPIKDVKASLVSCNWDIDDAQKDLRKRGVILAAKKSSRTAAEGLLAMAQDEKRAAVVELNCETDFVARNDVFQHLASSLAKMALSVQDPGKLVFPFAPAYLENLSMNLDHPKLSGETTVRNAVTEVAAMVGENVKLRRGFMFSTTGHGVVSSYVHNCPQPGLGRIVGLVTLQAEDSSAPLDVLNRVGSSIAMHIVASKPLFLSKELVSSAAVESERDVLRTQAESSGKSPMAMEKMVEGRLRKYFEEVVLLEQKYVVDDSKNIKTLLNDLSKEVGSKVTIGNFVRLEVGEGIERHEEAHGSGAMAQAA